jgi:hypothetical protein
VMIFRSSTTDRPSLQGVKDSGVWLTDTTVRVLAPRHTMQLHAPREPYQADVIIVLVCDYSVVVFKVNGREFEIGRSKAQIIPPTVFHSLCVDPTQSSFTIEVPNRIEHFETILSLCQGKAIAVDW